MKTKAKKSKPKKKSAERVETIKRNLASHDTALFERWVKGEGLGALAKQSGLKRSKFRRFLIQKAGGREAFRALRAKGAGGAIDPQLFGGKRAVRKAAAPIVEPPKTALPEDKKVPRVKQVAGLQGKFIAARELLRFPDGTIYREVRSGETPDAIIVAGEGVWGALPFVRAKIVAPEAWTDDVRIAAKALGVTLAAPTPPTAGASIPVPKSIVRSHRAKKRASVEPTRTKRAKRATKAKKLARQLKRVTIVVPNGATRKRAR